MIDFLTMSKPVGPQMVPQYDGCFLDFFCEIACFLTNAISSAYAHEMLRFVPEPHVERSYAHVRDLLLQH